MKDPYLELEQLITTTLKSNSRLKNEVENKVIEKHDLLKEISLGIIEVLDSFERIEENLIEKGQHKIENISKIMTRYMSLQKKLINLLNKYGITRIEFPDNKLIIGLCEVVETESIPDRRNDEIIFIVKNGYIRGKELIRAAQIIAVKN